MMRGRSLIKERKRFSDTGIPNPSSEEAQHHQGKSVKFPAEVHTRVVEDWPNWWSSTTLGDYTEWVPDRYSRREKHFLSAFRRERSAEISMFSPTINNSFIPD